jgi:hypothetical protein
VQPPRSTCNRGAGLFSIRLGQEPALIRSFVLGNEMEPQYLSGRLSLSSLLLCQWVADRSVTKKKKKKTGKCEFFLCFLLRSRKETPEAASISRAGRLARPAERPLGEPPGALLEAPR